MPTKIVNPKNKQGNGSGDKVKDPFADSPGQYEPDPSQDSAPDDFTFDTSDTPSPAGQPAQPGSIDDFFNPDVALPELDSKYITALEAANHRIDNVIGRSNFTSSLVLPLPHNGQYDGKSLAAALAGTVHNPDPRVRLTEQEALDIYISGGEFCMRYSPVRHLGEGGMAIVSVFDDAKTNTPVAIKAPLSLFFKDRFEDETYTSELAYRGVKKPGETKTRQHKGRQGVLGFRGKGSVGELPYTAFELGECNLKQWAVMEYNKLMGTNDPSTLKQRLNDYYMAVLGMVDQVLDTLVYAHSHPYINRKNEEKNSLVHRDIKPENIMMVRSPITGELLPKTGDWGIAGGGETEKGSGTMQDGAATMGMAPPEQYNPDGYANTEKDGRIDVYSIGCMLYQLLRIDEYGDKTAFPGEKIAKDITSEDENIRRRVLLSSNLNLPTTFDMTLKRLLMDAATRDEPYDIGRPDAKKAKELIDECRKSLSTNLGDMVATLSSMYSHALENQKGESAKSQLYAVAEQAENIMISQGWNKGAEFQGSISVPKDERYVTRILAVGGDAMLLAARVFEAEGERTEAAKLFLRASDFFDLYKARLIGGATSTSTGLSSGSENPLQRKVNGLYTQALAGYERTK